MNFSLGVMSSQVAPLEIFLRLMLAMLLGSAIGMERESIRRPAGLRTHTLVSLGSALFTLLSVYMAWWNGEFREPGRIAAQIVSGIGFLGAGTILRQRSGIRGLTTAASLWAVAGIGMAAGAGYYLGAVFATALVLISLTLFRRAERKLSAVIQDRILHLECPGPESVFEILQALQKFDIQIRESSAGISGGKPEMRLNVRLPENFDYERLMTKLLELGVLNYEWDDPA